LKKDDDSNSHVDFITATANLRARNYSIAETDKLKAKRVAGHIIPAIATSTAAVSGLVSIELIKVAAGNVKLESLKNAFLNLALPLFIFSEPAAAVKAKVTSDLYTTLWDRWDVRQGDITLKQFIDYFKQKFNLKVNGVFQEVTMVYVPFNPAHQKRLKEKMSKLLKREDSTEYIDLTVSFADLQDQEVTGPVIRYYIKS